MDLATFLALLFGVFQITHALVILRLMVILNSRRPRPVRSRPRYGKSSNEPSTTHLLVVLGSGGHTAEMLGMLNRAVQDGDEGRRLRWGDYGHRTWVVGSGDEISVQRAREFEERMGRVDSRNGEMNGYVTKPAKDKYRGYEVITVPRAREIHQSLFTAPISCLRCMLACFKVLLGHNKHRPPPDLILCNGPATATILVFTSLLLRFLNLRRCNSRGKMRTIYIESWARVKRLSLSGRLLEMVVDRFVVQWPQLAEEGGGRVEYLGVLV